MFIAQGYAAVRQEPFEARVRASSLRCPIWVLIGGPLRILECCSDIHWRRTLHHTLHWLHTLREVRAREDVPLRAEG